LQDIVADRRLRMAGHIIRMPPGRPANHAMSWTLVVVADDEVVQRRRDGPHLRRTWWTEESIGTASGLWLQTGADDELLLPIVLSRTGGSKDHVTNMEVLSRTGQRRLQDIVADRRLRMAGHIIRMLWEHVRTYSMANCYSDKDQLADQSCVTLTTSSPCSGNATFRNLS